MAPDTDDRAAGLRRIMQRAPSAVLVVTSSTPEEMNGLTVSSFCSVSMDPASVLVCVSHESSTHAIISASGRFCANFLGRDQEEVAMAFASSGTGQEKLERAKVNATQFDGLASIDGAIAKLVCDVSQTMDAGTHTVFLGDVKEIAFSEEGEPLMYGMQGFGSFVQS